MAEKMAASLEELRKLQEKDRCVVLQGTVEIGRTHLTRLLDNGWLQEVMKGWYIAARPGTEAVSYTHLDVYKRQEYKRRNIRSGEA